MKVITNYTALKITSFEDTRDDTNKIELSHGSYGGPYYSRNTPEKTFSTEEEAIKYAYKTDKYGEWLIIPKIMFDNFDTED